MFRSSCPPLHELERLEGKARKRAILELLNNQATANDPRFLMDSTDFDVFFGVRDTLTTKKVLQALANQCSACEIRNLLDGKCYPNVTLSCCNAIEEPCCDPHYPYRSYDGSCNNLEHPSWRMRGRPLKHPIAPCFSDLVAEPARSKSGAPLPQNRKFIAELAEMLREREISYTAELNMCSVFLSEFFNLDMIGRSNKRTKRATDGFRGCRADGQDRSPFSTPLSNPLLVEPDDPHYGCLGVRCLNFSPQESANDRCELKHVADWNMQSSYLDLSHLYTERATYDRDGRLLLEQCGAPEFIVNARPIGYCVDRAPADRGPVAERCRAFTIGVYQKILYEQLLRVLFGEQFYNECNLSCEYDPHEESAVSQVYKHGLGRYQHVWIGETMLYKPLHGEPQWRPFNDFFHNFESFDCLSALAGSLDTPIHIGNLSSASVDKFVAVDGVRGTCLPCIDLARNRDAGLCPLVTYKHHLERLFGEESKCYSTFEELSDIFEPDVDIDVLFANMDQRFDPGASLPRMVSQFTCLEMKRLKCTDRFFYTWNPHLGEGARQLIHAMDFTVLLALFTELDEVPLHPFFVGSPTVPSCDVRSYMKALHYHFANLCPKEEQFFEYEKEAFIKAIAELLSNDEKAQNGNYRIGSGEFDFGLFQTKAIKGGEDLEVRRTLTTDKFLKTLAKKLDKCELQNLLDGKCNVNRTLSCCNGEEMIACDSSNPYRSYDGSCNNLEHPSWGKRGRPLKHPIAPCFSDVVSKPARSKSGAPLPQNRKLIAELAEFLDQQGTQTSSSLNMFMVFWMEAITSDMIGRANKRAHCPTQGFRGCRADGQDRSAFVSALVNPLRVSPNDPHYGGCGVRCLNFSPQEKANDRCELKHTAERNMESSYLDLSSMYGEEPHYDEHGKLPLFHCGATEPIVQSAPIAVQFSAIIGLFAQLHNYCVDRVRSCSQSKRSVEERCRALTIGVYQKIIYDQLLPLLFGDELYNLAGFDCEYNPYEESAISQVYKNGPGRFPHLWITEQVAYKYQGKTQWRPLNEYFRNHQSFDCTATLAGALETPIETDRLVDSIVHNFYTLDGTRGSCLPCIDLARNRDSGLCPLVNYKHFIEQIAGDESKCYNTFDDLRDMFSPEMVKFLATQYEHPGDIDVLFSWLDRRAYPGANMPRLVSQSTCLEFKRLKCTDRFFYKWNPNLGEGAKHLIEILDFTAMLAMFTEMEHVPLESFLVDGPKAAASDVRKYLESVEYLYCDV
uniref:Uncharacterized protein n=1 Tax=Anopheles epiroticus TaxID=199890 RepID=A0A182PE57_9DIPT